MRCFHSDSVSAQPATPSDFGSIGKPDVSIAEQQLQIQRSVLNQSMTDGLAERLLDNRDKTRDREARPLLPQALYQQLYEVIWSKSATALPHPGYTVEGEDDGYHD